MTRIYVDKNGKEFDGPDELTPELAAEAHARGLSPKDVSVGQDMAKSGASGLWEGMFRAPLIMGDAVKLGNKAINKIVPGAIPEADVEKWGAQGWIDAFRDSPQDKFLRKLGIKMVHEPETTAGRYTKAVGTGVGGYAATAGLGSAPGFIKPAAPMLPTAMSTVSPGAFVASGGAGAAGELGYDASRGFDESRPGNPLAALAASLGTGFGLGTVRNMRAPNYEELMANATKGMSGKDWLGAFKSRADFENSGSQSYTLADLPQLQSRLGGLAQRMATGTGGNLMQQKLSTQARTAMPESDIPQLLKSVKNDVYPGDVDPREVARMLSARGAQQFEEGITPVSPIAPSGVPPSANPNVPLLAGQRGLSTDVRMPPKNIGPDLGPRVGPSPAVDEAMDVPFYSTPDLTKSQKLVGTIRGAYNADSILSRLRQVPAHKLGEEVSQLNLSQDETLKLARVLADKLRPIKDVTAASESTKLDRNIFQTLVDSVDPALGAKVGNKLSVTDSLARLSAEHASDSSTQLHLSKNWMQWAAPGSTLRFRSGLATSAKETGNLSEIMGNPTKENLAKLQELAKTDPAAKRMLQFISTLNGSMTGDAIHQPE